MDDEERKTLILSHTYLVRFLAYKMVKKMPQFIEEDDFIGSGMIGLIEAANNFDPAKGTPFKTYAWRRIVGAMRDNLRSLDWVPRSVRDKKIEPYSYKDVIQFNDKLTDPSKLVECKQEKGVFFDAVKSLSEKEKQVIFLCYYEDMTMKQAGRKLKISESRVCQIHKSAIADLFLVLSN